jgi:putative salt-induced outer membrane protein YdiY
MSRRLILAVPVAALLVATVGRAQDAAPPVAPTLPAAAEVAPVPKTPPPLWRTELDLGYVSAAGNANVRTLNVAEQVAFAPGLWRFSQVFSIVNGYTDGAQTVNTLKAGLRADYAVGTRFRLFVLGDFTQDRFAGIARRFEEATGLAYVICTGPTNVLDAEVGLGRNQQTAAGGPMTQYWVSRLASHYRLNFTSRAYFEQRVEALTDLANAKNLLVNTESALVAPVSTNVGLKLGYTVRFANEPPDPNLKKTDTVLSAGLQLLF